MQEFSTKRDALFACLDDASKELKGTALDQTKSKVYSINALERHKHGARRPQQRQDVMNYRQGRSTDAGGNEQEDEKLRRMRGKESIFKKPELPIGRCLKPRKTPDYLIRQTRRQPCLFYEKWMRNAMLMILMIWTISMSLDLLIKLSSKKRAN